MAIYSTMGSWVTERALFKPVLRRLVKEGSISLPKCCLQVTDIPWTSDGPASLYNIIRLSNHETTSPFFSLWLAFYMGKQIVWKSLLYIRWNSHGQIHSVHCSKWVPGGVCFGGGHLFDTSWFLGTFTLLSVWEPDPGPFTWVKSPLMSTEYQMWAQDLAIKPFQNFSGHCKYRLRRQHLAFSYLCGLGTMFCRFLPIFQSMLWS